MGISENPPAEEGAGAAWASQFGCFQELSSAQLAFLSAVCCLVGQLRRIGTMCGDVTVLLIRESYGWMCGTVVFCL